VRRRLPQGWQGAAPSVLPPIFSVGHNVRWPSDIRSRCLAIDISEGSKPPQKSIQMEFGVFRRPAAEKADHWHCLLLSTCDCRPSHSAADTSEKFPPSHALPPASRIATLAEIAADFPARQKDLRPQPLACGSFAKRAAIYAVSGSSTDVPADDSTVVTSRERPIFEPLTSGAALVDIGICSRR
jgi:hypothetical protein